MPDLKKQLDDLKESVAELVEEKVSLESDLKVIEDRIKRTKKKLKDAGHPTKVSDAEKVLEKMNKEFESELEEVRTLLSRLEDD